VASEIPGAEVRILPYASFFLAVGLLSGFAVAASAFSVPLGIQDTLRPIVGIIAVEIAVVVVFVPFARQRYRSVRRGKGKTPHDLISAGKFVRGRLYIEQYQSFSERDREVFVTGVIDTLNQMIRYCDQSYKEPLLLMSDYAEKPDSRELRDMFDQYIAANPHIVAGIYAANAFELFLSEATRIAVGGRPMRNQSQPG
jgi:hypothetical protein